MKKSDVYTGSRAGCWWLLDYSGGASTPRGSGGQGFDRGDSMEERGKGQGGVMMRVHVTTGTCFPRFEKAGGLVPALAPVWCAAWRRHSGGFVSAPHLLKCPEHRAVPMLFPADGSERSLPACRKPPSHWKKECPHLIVNEI